MENLPPQNIKLLSLINLKKGDKVFVKNFLNRDKSDFQNRDYSREFNVVPTTNLSSR